MKALILCAGRGTRLLPHTEAVPKCLVPVCGTPILEYQLAALRSLVDEVVLVTGYHGEQIRRTTDGSCTIVHNPDYATTNSLYSLSLTREHLDGRPFVLLNGDLVIDRDAVRPLLAHDAPTASLVDARAELVDGEMNVVIAGDRITEFSKSVPAKRAHALSLQVTKFGSTDSHRLFARAAELVRAGETNRFPAFAYDTILADSRMAPVQRSGGIWFEIDTLDDLASAEAALSRPASPSTSGPTRARL